MSYASLIRSLTPLCLLALTVTGCSSGPDDVPELGQVTGIVTLDGEPLANVSVSFIPDSGSASSGTTDSEGRYTLVYLDQPGAVIGTHTVTIETPTEAPMGPDYVDPVPAEYNTESTLTADVKAGPNDIPFELESN